MAELDRGFAGYATKVKRRTGLKDRHIADGWMRGQGGPAPMRPDELPRIAGLTGLDRLSALVSLCSRIAKPMNIVFQ